MKLSAEDQEIVAATARFCAAEFPKYLPLKDVTPAVLPRDLFAAFGTIGLTALASGEQYGGVHRSNFLIASVLEEIASHDLGPAIFLSVHLMVAKIIERFAVTAVKEKILPQLCSGIQLGAFALTEPSAGSDASALKTEFVKTNTGFKLNGEKCYITSAGFADVYVVFARESKTSGKDGISAFLVSRDAAGFSCSKPEKKMGCELSPIASVTLNDCEVPLENLLGELGGGYKIALSGLAAGRISIGACANGLSRSAISRSTNYLKQRKQFGQPLSEFQGLQFMVADMRMAYESAVAMVAFAATSLDANDFSDEPNLYPSIAKCTATDNAMRITTDAVQLFGGAGYIKEYAVEGLMRDAKMLQIVEGSNQIQRTLIAKATLKKFKNNS